MANKVITMMVTEGNSRITFADTLADDASWMAQSYLFHKFLLAQGYILEAEDVCADVDAYVNAEVSSEDF